MEEDECLGSLRGAAVVVGGDAVEKLGPDRGVELVGARLDEPQTEVDVAEETCPPAVGAYSGRTVELLGSPGVVQDRRREQEVAAQAPMELGRLAAERGDPHRVLEQAAGVA